MTTPICDCGAEKAGTPHVPHGPMKCSTLGGKDKTVSIDKAEEAAKTVARFWAKHILNQPAQQAPIAQPPAIRQTPRTAAELEENRKRWPYQLYEQRMFKIGPEPTDDFSSMSSAEAALDAIALEPGQVTIKGAEPRYDPPGTFKCTICAGALDENHYMHRITIPVGVVDPKGTHERFCTQCWPAYPERTLRQCQGCQRRVFSPTGWIGITHPVSCGKCEATKPKPLPNAIYIGPADSCRGCGRRTTLVDGEHCTGCIVARQANPSALAERAGDASTRQLEARLAHERIDLALREIECWAERARAGKPQSACVAAEVISDIEMCLRGHRSPLIILRCKKKRRSSSNDGPRA